MICQLARLYHHKYMTNMGKNWKCPFKKLKIPYNIISKRSGVWSEFFQKVIFQTAHSDSLWNKQDLQLHKRTNLLSLTVTSKRWHLNYRLYMQHYEWNSLSTCKGQQSFPSYDQYLIPSLNFYEQVVIIFKKFLMLVVFSKCLETIT